MGVLDFLSTPCREKRDQQYFVRNYDKSNDKTLLVCFSGHGICQLVLRPMLRATRHCVECRGGDSTQRLGTHRVRAHGTSEQRRNFGVGEWSVGEFTLVGGQASRVNKNLHKNLHMNILGLTLVLLMGGGKISPAHFCHQNSGTAKDQAVRFRDFS